MPPDVDMQSLVDVVPKPGAALRADRDLPLPAMGSFVNAELRIDWNARYQTAQV
jgi:hypothetical protein